jgi:hypothetical protein
MGVASFVGVVAARGGVGVCEVTSIVSCVEGIKDATGEPWVSITAGPFSTAGRAAGMQDWIKNTTRGMRIRLLRTVGVYHKIFAPSGYSGVSK